MCVNCIIHGTLDNLNTPISTALLTLQLTRAALRYIPTICTNTTKQSTVYISLFSSSSPSLTQDAAGTLAISVIATESLASLQQVRFCSLSTIYLATLNSLCRNCLLLKRLQSKPCRSGLPPLSSFLPSSQLSL